MNIYGAVTQREDLVRISPGLPGGNSGGQPVAAGHAQLRQAQPAWEERSSPAANRGTAGALMPGENLARFWELRGRRVFERNGVLWGHYKGPFFSSLPFHLRLDAEPDEVRSIFRSTGVRGLRFPSKNRPGLPAGLYVCRPTGYGLHAVSRKQRGHVSRGLESCEMRIVDPDELLSEGLQLNRDTLARQERADATFLDPAQWKQFVDAVSRCPGMSIHGAYAKGRLAAYMISCREGEWLHLMYKMSRAADLEHHPNHALDYSVIREAASDPGIQFIGNGFQSLVENEGLDRYKRQMGYEIAEHNLCIHLTPGWSAVLGNRMAVAAAKKAASVFPRSERLVYGAQVLEGARLSRPRRTEEPTASDDLCQQEEALGFSRLLRPASLFPVLRVFQTLRKGGVRFMVRRGSDYLRARLTGSGKRKPVARRPLTADEVLELQPGELVEVKSLAEIRATLDERGKNRGLLFTDDMRGFAGQHFRVFKRVESIFLEESKQRRTLKNTVILENAYCPGITFRCDRSCFLFFKEAWLRRVEPTGSGGQQGRGQGRGPE